VKVKHADKQSSADADEMRRQAAEARYRTLFEHAPVGILISDAQSYCLDANASMCRMLGYTRAELIGLHASGIVVPTEIQHIAPALNDIKAKSDYHREWQFRRKDGSAFSAEVSATLMPDGTVLGMVSDITERKQAEQLLQTSEREQRQLSQLLEIERFRLVTAQRVAKIGSWETDIATMAIIWSEETYRIHETDPASFRPTHQGFMEYVHPEDRAAVDEAFRQSLNQRAACVIDHRLLMPGGRIKFVEERWQMFFDEGGQPTRAIGTCQDITERKETEARIAYLIHVYAMLSGINALIVRVHDRDELFREACRIAVEDGGFRMAMLCMEDRLAKKIVPVATAGKDEELLTSITERLSSSKDASNTMVALAIREKQAVVSNDSVNDPRVLFGKKYAESGVRSLAILPLIISGEAVGTLALYSSEVEFFHEEELKLLTELASDIAFAVDHIEKQERLNYLAYYDVLTGLANRNLFLDRVAQYMRSAVSAGHKLALGLIDLERFKNFNDTLGRPTGDALLKQVAEWLTHKMGDINLLARVDADHFAIVLPEVKSDGNLARLVENLMAAFLGHSFRLNDAALRIGVKAGIALFPDDGADADTLFKNAEAALKKAKSSGDRYLFYTQKMTEAVAAKLTLENQLREALDNEEFVLHYQPKVNLVSGKVTGAEALIRWNDPRTGLVPPGQFIPILEETGLIYEVGRWALRKAIEDYLRWRSAGLPALRIAVNVSPLQLRNPGFVAEIERKIGIDPHAAEGLELEITESMIMEDVKHNIASLQAIRAMGITIAIDDFGTGFSSLGYLSKLPVDTLKIDRSFVIGMAEGSEGLALVSTIISLAHALKLKVVAEGVETEEQSHLLNVLSCDEIQGFLFSKPVPAEIFETQFLVRQ
jgi:diguanylate cyclase (GGDEF)-like protein/PAS domain S-box-containing protein